MILSLTRCTIIKTGSTTFIFTYKITLGAGTTNDSSSTFQTETDKFRTKFTDSILREVCILTFSTLSPGAIAFHTMQGFIGTLRTFRVIIEKVIPFQAICTSGVAGTSHASLKRCITGDTDAFPICVIEVLKTGLTEGIVGAGLTMRDIGNTRDTSHIVQIVIVRYTFSADILISAFFTPFTKNSACHAFPIIHKGSIFALIATISSTALAIGKLGRTLATSIVVGVVEV